MIKTRHTLSLEGIFDNLIAWQNSIIGNEKALI